MGLSSSVRPDEQIAHMLAPLVNQYPDGSAIEVIETTTDERKSLSGEIGDRGRKIEVCRLSAHHRGLVVMGIAYEPTDRSLLQASSNEHLAIGMTPHHLREAGVSSNQPVLAPGISSDPANVIDARPVVFEKACQGNC
jgi:hypothetical protein